MTEETQGVSSRHRPALWTPVLVPVAGIAGTLMLWRAVVADKRGFVDRATGHEAELLASRMSGKVRDVESGSSSSRWRNFRWRRCWRLRSRATAPTPRSSASRWKSRTTRRAFGSTLAGAAAPRPRILHVEAGSAPRPRVLHVDDDPDLPTIVAAALSEFVDVDVARGIREARERLAAGTYDVVVLPDGSGLKLQPLLASAAGKSTPYVLFTAHEIPRESAPAAAAVLTKSRSTLADLVESVKSLLAEPATHTAGQAGCPA